ncbi:hypothetical protein NIES4074_36420 [Cylindrospermum sp. NIES-4074]|nr:hypothetical protein NIES4074_36420 [Cylindrospermum sp. NIES-4074]
MTVQELIDRLQQIVNKDSTVLIKEAFVWINTSFRLERVDECENGQVALCSNTVFYDSDDEMNPYTLDEEGNVVPCDPGMEQVYLPDGEWILRKKKP